MSRREDRQLVLRAMLMALWQRRDLATVIPHSDRGTQLTSDAHRRFLAGTT